jgi:DNA polymerase-1
MHEAAATGISRPQTRCVKVYDLLNAGPRHRFTVSGKIVSNSYCLSPPGLSRQAKIPMEEAEQFMTMFFKRYAGIVEFRKRMWARAREEHGRVINLFGRRRLVPAILSPDSYERGRGERQLIGSLIQGTAAELTKESLVRIDAGCRRMGWPVRLVNTVHDEIQMDIPTALLPEVARLVKAEMERYPEFAPIPIKVEGAVATKTWADKTEYKIV